MQKSVITLNMLVDNEFGVLTRITSLVRREGYNIKSLAVDVTDDASVSQLLLSVECMVSTLPNILSRLNRLGCVRHAAQVTRGFDLSFELRKVFLRLNETTKGGAADV